MKCLHANNKTGRNQVTQIITRFILNPCKCAALYWSHFVDFFISFRSDNHRKPKVEKTKPDKNAEQQQVSKKKKGFLPETKKRKKRKNPVLEPAGEKPTSTDKPGADKGQGKKKHDKKTKQKRQADGATASQPSPAKKSKTLSESKQAKKKKKKPKQKKEGGGKR